MAEVAVVILNWNGVHFLGKFLPPLIKFTDQDLAEIWVADNGSTDASLELLRKDFPIVKTIELGENYGFAEGYNRALDQIDTPYFVLLNSDVEVSENWLTPLYNTMKDNASLGACMPKIKSWHDKDSFEHAGAAGGFIDKFGYPFCRGRIFNQIEKDSGQFDSDLDIFWASGACLMIRSDLYKRSGGLDPFFFAHMEEIDLCWRIKNLGYKIKFCWESTIYHIGGGTLPKHDHNKTYLNFRNNIILLYKNLPAGRLFRILFPRLILDWISMLQFLVKLELRNFSAVIKAHLFLLFHIPSIRRLRAKNLKLDGFNLHPEIYPGSIVYNFFIKGEKHYRQLEFHP
ncbi:MAG: glycosyltransferase family 2 protein [Bacteroidales bacterium]|nr:glycosyltransferase family 2 protein [Bacteroidales bacterium]